MHGQNDVDCLARRDARRYEAGSPGGAVLDRERARIAARLSVEVPLVRKAMAVRVTRWARIQEDILARCHGAPHLTGYSRRWWVIGLRIWLDAPIEARLKISLEGGAPTIDRGHAGIWISSGARIIISPIRVAARTLRRGFEATSPIAP